MLIALKLYPPIAFWRLRTGKYPKSVMAACALFAALVPVHAAPRDPLIPPQSHANWDLIAFEAKSWGEPVSKWQIARDGSGVWVEIKREPNAPLGQYALAYHQIEPQLEHYTEVLEILGKVPDPAPDHSACRSRIPDMPYGKIRFTRAATTIEIDWNAGCQEREYREFMATLKDADRLVQTWGESSPVIREDRSRLE